MYVGLKNNHDKDVPRTIILTLTRTAQQDKDLHINITTACIDTGTYIIIRSKPCHLAFNIVLEELYQQGTKIYLYVGLKNNPTVIDL